MMRAKFSAIRIEVFANTLLKAMMLASLTLICSGLATDAQGAQQNTRDVASSADQKRLPQPSDLANENYEHLAAAPRQIQEVLLKDSGLLVELKRLAIKQATDNGQIVEDSELTDQAIFDRLELDIKFRSLATRLVPLLADFRIRVEAGQ